MGRVLLCFSNKLRNSWLSCRNSTANVMFNVKAVALLGLHNFIYTSAEKADSQNHVEVKGNNFLSTVLLISEYDDATLSQNSVSGKVSNRSRQLESFFKSINWSCNSSSTFSGESRNGFLASNRSSALTSGKYDLNSLSSSFRC